MLTEVGKVINSEELSELFEIIELMQKLPQEYLAIRLQSTELIIAISHILSKQEANQKLIPGLLQYVLKGFLDINLTLPVSSYCFRFLCESNAQVIAPYALELVQQILVPQFVEQWFSNDKFADIMRGFGFLIP